MMTICSKCKETMVCFVVAKKFYCEKCNEYLQISTLLQENENLHILELLQEAVKSIKVSVVDIELGMEDSSIIWTGKISVLPSSNDLISVADKYYLVDDYTWWLEDNPITCTMYVTPEEE